MSRPARTSFAASLIPSTLISTSRVISAWIHGEGRLYPIQQPTRANMRTSKPVIIVHGGAGDWPSELHKKGLKGVKAAADRGFRVLFRGGYHPAAGPGCIGPT